MRGRRNHLAGRVFGNLTVLDDRVRGADRKLMWLCRCTCGVEVWKRADNLVLGLTKSCDDKHRWSGEVEGVRDVI